MSVLTALSTITPTPTDIRLAQEVTRRIAGQNEFERSTHLQIVDSAHPDETLEVPEAAVQLLLAILSEMGSGNAVTLVPMYSELTTQQAADMLNVSRPFLIRLLEDGTIPYRKVGSHRRVVYRDILDYKTRIDSKRLDTLAELTAQAQELNMGYSAGAASSAPNYGICEGS